MHQLIYEIHSFPDSRLPFIFHKRCSATNRARFVNWHENIEILLCTEGTGTVHCANDDIAFTQGDIFVLNPNVPHTLSSPLKVRYQCLIIDNNFCMENGIPVDQTRFADLIQSSTTVDLFRKVAKAFDQEDTHTFSALQIRLSILNLLQNLCQYHSNPGQRPDSFSGIHVKKALQFIRSNLMNPITLDDITAYVGISKYHLSRKFREQTGSSIIETINMMRCIHARQLLEKGTSVREAAAASGFENASYFTKTFQQYVGCLPSQIKQTRNG